MIVQGIIYLLLSLVSLPFKFFVLPALPLVIVDAMNGIFQYLAIPIGLMRQFMGDAFFSAIVVAIIVYITFVPSIHIIIWIYQRVFK